jgi:hypothetical protein
MRPGAAQSCEGEEKKETELHRSALRGWVKIESIAERFELATAREKLARAPNPTAPIGIFHHEAIPARRLLSDQSILSPRPIIERTSHPKRYRATHSTIKTLRLRRRNRPVVCEGVFSNEAIAPNAWEVVQYAYV